jgi:phage gp29-like protein
MPKTPTKKELLERLNVLEKTWVPRNVETINDPRNEPASTLVGLSAERVHSAITQAEAGDTRELFSIYRDVLIADSHLQSVVETRLLAVIGDEPMVSPVDKNKPEDVAAAEAIKAAIDRLPDFLGLCRDLLWGAIWPVSIVERTYKPAGLPGLEYDWGEILAVPDHLLRWTRGVIEVELVDPQSRRPAGQFVELDPARYITHKGHLLKTADNWGGPMRALSWWFFLKVMDREWWVRFLDKFGTPFMVGKFDKADDKSRQVLERAFALATKVGGVAVNKETTIELLKAGTGDSAGSFENFYRICDDAIARRVLGQTLSSTASATGIGGGASGIQSEVRGDIAAFDKKRLAQTLRTQLFKPWLRLNKFTGAPPRIAFGGEEAEENSTTATVLKDLKAAGVRISDKSLPILSQRVGLELERDPAAGELAPGAEPGTAGAPGLPGVRTLSAPLEIPTPENATSSISRRAAAMISQAYRGTLAPAREILLTSSTPEEAERRLLAAFGDWDPTRAAEVIESAFAAGAWNGLQ